MLSSSKTIRFALPTFALIALFWGCLYNGDVLAFRDAMHFYYPLWGFLDRSSFDYWLLPHFNYLDRVGVPWIAEPTTMTFYPGRLLLRLPFISLEQSIAVFFIVHLGIAWFGSFYSIRRVCRKSAFAASIAASSYAFGGFTYFQIYNAPYLVSSAWLPFAFGALFAITQQGRTTKSTRSLRHWQALLILSLVAMCLAGDFQLPYNLGLLAAGLCAAVSVNKWHRNRAVVAANSIKASTGKSFAIAACFCLAAFCTAIQSIPTYRWMTLGNSSETIAQRGISDRYTFQSSYLLTCVIPNCLGNYTPTHTRWVAGLTQDSMWVASIH
nr:hypothetical protein [Pirellula sp.]